MTADVVVGLDLGTTETKALVVGTDGRRLGFARGDTPWNGAETTADALFRGALDVLAAALADAATATGRRVRTLGLGLTGLGGENGLRQGSPSAAGVVLENVDLEKGEGPFLAGDRVQVLNRMSPRVSPKL